MNDLTRQKEYFATCTIGLFVELNDINWLSEEYLYQNHKIHKLTTMKKKILYSTTGEFVD
jgi:hypothetical protein